MKKYLDEQHSAVLGPIARTSSGHVFHAGRQAGPLGPVELPASAAILPLL